MTKKLRKKYHFYYDESGHDKKITENAISTYVNQRIEK